MTTIFGGVIGLVITVLLIIYLPAMIELVEQVLRWCCG